MTGVDADGKMNSLAVIYSENGGYTSLLAQISSLLAKYSSLIEANLTWGMLY